MAKQLEKIAEVLVAESRRSSHGAMAEKLRAAYESDGLDALITYHFDLERDVGSQFDSLNFSPPPQSASPELLYLWSLRCQCGLDMIRLLFSHDEWPHRDDGPERGPVPSRAQVDERWFVGPLWWARRDEWLLRAAVQAEHAIRRKRLPVVRETTGEALLRALFEQGLPVSGRPPFGGL